MTKSTSRPPRATAKAKTSRAPKLGAVAGSTPVLFPRNPQRDDRGNAVLYPGMPKFVGVAGLFTTEDGEVVILAPTFEALDAHVRRMGIAAEVFREKCIITEGRRL